MHVTAAIIAGGLASRFGGRDKSSLRVGNRPILDRQMEALRPLTDCLLVVANRPEPFATYGLDVVADAIPGVGALGGIYTALTAAKTEYVLVLAADLPFITAPFLRFVVAEAASVDLAIPRPADGYQPLCACYARACLEPIRRRIAAGVLSVHALAAEVRTRQIGPAELAEYDPHGLLFFNVNAPADLARAQQLAEQHEGQTNRIMQRGVAASTDADVPPGRQQNHR